MSASEVQKSTNSASDNIISSGLLYRYMRKGFFDEELEGPCNENEEFYLEVRIKNEAFELRKERGEEYISFVLSGKREREERMDDLLRFSRLRTGKKFKILEVDIEKLLESFEEDVVVFRVVGENPKLLDVHHIGLYYYPREGWNEAIIKTSKLKRLGKTQAHCLNVIK